jgi:hypothetical protein
MTPCSPEPPGPPPSPAVTIRAPDGRELDFASLTEFDRWLARPPV